MTLPVYLHSGMQGAPTLSLTNGSANSVLNACLVNGFNTQSVVSATASGGVVTFNFASGPGFSALDTVTVAGATNATVNGSRRVQSSSGNQVLVAIPGVPDGAVGGTITMKFSPLGWTRPYSGTGVAAYRQGGSATHKRFLRVFDNTMTSATRWYARGYGNMTAVSTGTDPFPDLTTVPGNGGEFYSPFGTGNKYWWVIGTPRAFYFVYQFQQETPTENDTLIFCFGDLSRIAKAGDTYAQVIPNTAGFPDQSLWVCRSHSGVSNTTRQLTLHGFAGNTTGGLLPYPDPASGGVTLLDAPFVYESQSGPALRGHLPGMLCSINAVPSTTFLSNVSGVTGRLAFFKDVYGGSQGIFALLLDEDWGDV